MSLIRFQDSKGKYYPHLYINTDSGIFYSVIRKGERVFKSSLETTDFNTARSRIAEKFKELDVTKYVKKQNKLLREYFNDLLKEKEAEELQPGTINKIKTVWEKSINPFWGHLNTDKVNQDMVTEFIVWHKENREGIQFQNTFKYLGNLFRFLFERTLIAKRPTLTIPKAEQRHIDKKKGRVITLEERNKIYSKLTGEYLLITQIAYETGMRQMEIGSMQVSRVKKIKDCYVFELEIEDTKNELARVVPMPKFLNSQIKERLQNTYYLFPMKSDPKRHIPPQMIDKAWQEAKRLAKIQGRLRFHDLRHSCATRTAKSGMNPAVACTILGMNLKTYQKTYLNLSVDDLIIVTEGFYPKSGGTSE